MTRVDLHRLVDELPEESVDAAVVLTCAKDPVLAALQAAPFDDEPETEEERRGATNLLPATTVRLLLVVVSGL
jgi:hypothetical protein